MKPCRIYVAHSGLLGSWNLRYFGDSNTSGYFGFEGGEKNIAQSVTRESFFILYFYDIVIMLVLAYASQFSLRSLEAHTLWY